MGLRRVGILLTLLVCLALNTAYAQAPPPSDQFILTGKLAATWSQGGENIVLLHGPVQIALDHTTLTADDAVVWLNPASPDNLEVEVAQIALLGHAKLEQSVGTRSGDRLFVTAEVRAGGIRIVADERAARDDSKSDLFARADELRKSQPAVVAPSGPATMRSSSTQRSGQPAPHPAGPPKFEAPVVFESQTLETLNTDEGNVALVLTGGVHLVQVRPSNDYIELSADRAVLFTPLKSLKELQQSGGKKRGSQSIESAYLEGDVRIDYVPAKAHTPEQRLTGDRVFYEFASDRAILTDAVIHTIEPMRGTPIIMRAKLVRQLAAGEYKTENVQLTNSSFAVPSYGIAAEKLYMRAEDSGDPRIGERVFFTANNATFEAFDLPFFFLPETSGVMTQHGLALRGVSVGHDSDFGTFMTTTWGLFESLGQVPPRDLDVNYRLDYFDGRGPGFGLNAAYGGGAITDTTRQPLDFDGQFKSYFVYDRGSDDVGRAPVRVDNPPTLRGQVLWEHQHLFPDGWQVQARLGYISDPTFMEQWFRSDFEEGPPHDLMGYIKHQEKTEAFTFGAIWQPMGIVTNSNFQQENFEVDRLPEIGYYREGDALLGDHVTFFSENVGGGLHYARSRDSLADQGFNPISVYTPGLAAEGYTGVTGQVVWRGDFRQEFDWPFSLGPLRVDPYVMGRYTQYSNTPQSSQLARGLAGTGMRVTTELWKVDPSAQSALFDIHQIRHVITPEINLFTSAMNVQRQQVFVYDPEVDAINDISAAQFAIHQRWETKRGGPGQWRSVDMFDLNVEVDIFDHKPATKFNNPYDFRGMYFTSYPEESVPRDALNVDASWRLSDNTVLLGDMSYNLDRGNLQTLAIGALVRRDVRLSYFLGNRYIADVHSNITSVHADYQMTAKYLFDVDQEFDFTQGKNVYSSAAIIRQFDTFYMAFKYYFDETTKQNGVSFNIYPMGLGYGLDTSSFNTYHR